MKNTIKRIDNSDGTYTLYEIYDKPYLGIYLSSIIVYNSNNQDISEKYFSDVNFKNLAYTSINDFNNIDDLCETTQIYEQMQEWGSAIIAKLDKEQRPLKQAMYKDKDCTLLISLSNFEYNDDGSYIERTRWNIDKYSSCRYFNADGKIVQETVYNDLNFSNENNQSNYIYEKNLIKIHTIFKIPCYSGEHSKIEYFDVNESFIKGVYFEDNNFQNILYKKQRKYTRFGYLDVYQHSKYDTLAEKSYVDFEIYNNKNQITYAKNFFFLNGLKKYWFLGRKIGHDEQITEYLKYEVPLSASLNENIKFTYKSLIQECTKDSDKFKYYEDNSFKNFIASFEYVKLSNGTYKSIIFDSQTNRIFEEIYENN